MKLSPQCLLNCEIKSNATRQIKNIADKVNVPQTFNRSKMFVTWQLINDTTARLNA